MPAEWQLVAITLQRDGWLVYQFRHRALFAAGSMTSAVCQDVRVQHPRDDWRIACWVSEDAITAPMAAERSSK